MTIKDSKYIKINSVNPLYLIFSKVNGCFVEINENKYLTLISTNEYNKKIKIHEQLWSNIGDLIRLITKNSDDYDVKYIKIKFNSDDKLTLDKTIETPSMITVFRAVFHEIKKCHLQVFLDKCLYKL